MTTGNEPKTTAERDYPPLPEPFSAAHEDAGAYYPDTFSADQMQAYYDLGREAGAREAVGIPAGWKLVPVEPTEDMKAAAVKYTNGERIYRNLAAEALRIEEGIYGEVYEAMLAASPAAQAAPAITSENGNAIQATPQPPAQAQEPVAVFDAMRGRPVLLASAPMLLDKQPLYTHPAPQQAVPAYQRALDIRTAQGWKLGGDKVPVLYTDTINGEQVCRDDVWLCTTAAFAQQAVPASEQAGAPETLPCERCSGNGEIVTDWDRYKHPRPGDVGDEAVADCPDCDGTGRVDSPASGGAAPVAEGDALPREDFAWLVVQEACETEPADEDDPECIRILCRDLKSAVLGAFLRHDAARAQTKEGDKQC